MDGRYLIDTNVIIAVFNGERTVGEKFRQTGLLYLSVVSLGELYFGAMKSPRAIQNVARLQNLALDISVGPCGKNTARIYGDLKNALRSIGRPIPDNDIWIAASAIEHDLTLATRDQHFSAVPELKTERW